MRLASAVVALSLLTACGAGEDLPAGNTIECALGGAADFAEDCTMERVNQDGQRYVIVRHPDGAFRRFEIGVPERGLVTADGVEQAEVNLSGDIAEIRVGSDRYRLPIAEQ